MRDSISTTIREERRPRLPLLFLLLSSLVASHSLQAQERDTLDEIRTQVMYLSSDALEGRRAGTEGNLMAAGYIAGKFAEYGLKPVGESYFAEFRYLFGVNEGIGSILSIHPWIVPHSNPPGTKLMWKEFSPASIIPLGFSATDTVNGRLSFVGYGISSVDPHYDDFENIDIKGHVVVMLRYSPDGTNPHGDLFDESGLLNKVLNARSKGAVGVILVDSHDSTNSKIPLSLTRSSTDVGIPVLSVRLSDMDFLRDTLGQDLLTVRKRIDSLRIPQSFVYRDRPGYLEATMGTVVHADYRQVPNILAVLPGTDPRYTREIIVVGAHFDHLGHGGEGSLHGHMDSAIHNGADDNASGTVGVIELARRFAERGDNRRTIIFMAFNAEEEGLLGSAALLKDAPFDTSQVVAMINLDMIGRMKENEIVLGGVGSAVEWNEIIAAANDDSLAFSPVQSGNGPSDHASFYTKNIPVLFLFTGLHDDYHKPTDDWEKVNYHGMLKTINFVERTIEEIDLRDAPPTFVRVVETSSMSGTGDQVRLRVVLGVIPDYAYDGKGLRISDVSGGGAAEAAGMMGGDIIVKLAGQDVGNIGEYMHALSAIEPGQTVDLIYQRDGAQVETTVTPRGR